MKLSGLLLGLAALSTTAFAHDHGTIKVYDAKFLPQIVSMLKPGNLVLEDGQKKTLFLPKTAKILNENLEKTRDFFAEELGRKSWDDKGADILASLNVNRYTLVDILGSKQNAAWMKTRFIFGAGDSKGLDNFEKALDVVAHEYTHAVIQTSANLVYEGESGALNEHLADVFGSIINQVNNPNLSNPYQIGATVLYGKYAEKAKTLRDMMDPSKGLTPQPGHTIQLLTAPYKQFAVGCVPSGDNDKCGVHILSGIPNKMSALVMSKIGPQESAKLFYGVMTKRLSANSKFADYSVALMQECKLMASDTCSIVNDALKAVGL